MKHIAIGQCELYLGNCTDIILEIGTVDTFATDPVWPNNSLDEFSGIKPYELFDTTWRLTELCCSPKRAIIHLGCDSDPAILHPISLSFFRVASLEYVLPSPKGRLLMTGDIAYMYGIPPRALPGKNLIPGKCISKNNLGKESDHPCPRKLEHVKWLIHQFTDPEDIVLDPFMGSGTTGVACIELGCKFIGIEINETYFNTACKRIKNTISQKQFDFGVVA